MKKFARFAKSFLAHTLALALMLPLLPLQARAVTVTSGSCGLNGDPVTWSFDAATGTMTISGNGMMGHASFTTLVDPDSPGNPDSFTGYPASACKPWNADQYSSNDSPDSEIRHVIVEEGITGIGVCMFAFCSNLETVKLPSSLKAIRAGAFCNCEKLTNIEMPSEMDGSIEQYAFSRTGIQKMNIPEGIEVIEPYTFVSCKNLTEITFPSTLKAINTEAFYQASALTSIVFPDGLTEIEYLAFGSCTSLTSVVFPHSLQAIRTSAFSNCTSLEKIFLPNDVKTIETMAFKNCTNLAKVVLPAALTEIQTDAFYGCASRMNVIFTGSTPPSTLADSIFSDNNPLAWYPEAQRDAYRSKLQGKHLGFQGYNAEPTLTYTTDPATLTLDTENPSITITSSDVRFSSNYILYGWTYGGEYPYDFEGPFTPVNTADFSTISDDERSITIPLKRAEETARASEEYLKITFHNCAFSTYLGDPAKEDIDFHKKMDVQISVPIQLPPDEPDPPQPDPPVIDPPPVEPEKPDDPTPPNSEDPEPEKPEEPAKPEEPEKPTPPNHSGGSSGGSSGGGSNSGGSSSSRTKTETVQPEEVLPPVVAPPTADKVCTIQHIAKVGEYVEWVERVAPPDYALQLYDALVMASNDKAPSASLGRITDYLIQDRYFTIDPNAPAGTDTPYEVDTVEEVTFGLFEPYASEGAALDSVVFESDMFHTVDAANSDRVIDYANLQLGSVVLTGTFNGIFVTKIPRGGDFDARKKEVCSYISTVFHAFDRDHPEVFWLSGKCKVRIITVANPATGAQEAYFFLALADNSGFTMRSPAWTAPGAVSEGLMRRDSAVSQILRNVTAADAAGKIRQLNTYLTEHNEYNTTPDLTSISNEPHECLVALEGRTGQNGPVCDGYARAFKVLCDRLGIPCVLENGYARSTPQAAGTFHMWNSVQIGGNWYGADITWDDPTVKGISGAKSGYENDRYLLVGSTTEIRGIAFSNSHPATNQAAKGGVSFDNGPALSPIAFSGAAVEAPASSTPFADVAGGAWYADSVQYVYDKKLMQGVSETAFQPESQSTRQQMWMILARLSGEKPASMAGARAWAMGYGVSDGTNPGNPVTRQQLVAYLYRYCQMLHCAGTASGSLSGYPDASGIADYAREAYAWAEGNGILTDAFQGALKPEQPATRAEFAVLLHGLCESTTGTQLISSLTRFGNS